MATTVQVKRPTRRILDRLKKEMGVKSYDDVIRILVESKRGIPGSLFGACRGSLSFKREGDVEHDI